MERTGETSTVFGVRLAQPRDALTRFAFATLAGSNRLWAGFVVGLPLACLLLSPVHDVFVSLAAGPPVVVCLWLLWMSHEFVDSRLVVDLDDGTLTKSKSYNRGQYSPSDVDDINHISIVPVSDAALVKLHYAQQAFSRPPDAAVLAVEVDTLTSQLERMGLDVSVRTVTPELGLGDPLWTRIVVTPIAVFGLLLAVWVFHGGEAFLANGVIVPGIVLIGYAVYGSIQRHRLRRSNLELWSLIGGTFFVLPRIDPSQLLSSASLACCLL